MQLLQCQVCSESIYEHGLKVLCKEHMKIKVYRPIRTDRQGQRFGENLACEKSDGKIISAISNGSCPIGSVSLYEKLGMAGHTGFDMGLWRGEPIYHSGEFSGWMKTEVGKHGGIGVDIVSNEPIFEYKGQMVHVELRYWHLKGTIGWDGKQVKEGDLIGTGDNTGLSSGDHLHFGMKPCDKYGKHLFGDNGYYGAIDILPYWSNIFVLDALNIKADILSGIQRAYKIIYNIKKLLGL